MSFKNLGDLSRCREHLSLGYPLICWGGRDRASWVGHWHRSKGKEEPGGLKNRINQLAEGMVLWGSSESSWESRVGTGATASGRDTFLGNRKPLLTYTGEGRASGWLGNTANYPQLTAASSVPSSWQCEPCVTSSLSTVALCGAEPAAAGGPSPSVTEAQRETGFELF